LELEPEWELELELNQNTMIAATQKHEYTHNGQTLTFKFKGITLWTIKSSMYYVDVISPDTSKPIRQIGTATGLNVEYDFNRAMLPRVIETLIDFGVDVETARADAKPITDIIAEWMNSCRDELRQLAKKVKV
jgi:phage host-nuclease inhibitor protein Gam